MLQVHRADLMARIAERAAQGPFLAGLTAKDAAVVAGAYSTLRMRDAGLMRGLAGRVLEDADWALSPAKTVMLAWAYGRLDVYHEPLMQRIAALLQVVLRPGHCLTIPAGGGQRCVECGRTECGRMSHRGLPLSGPAGGDRRDRHWGPAARAPHHQSGGLSEGYMPYGS